MAENAELVHAEGAARARARGLRRLGERGARRVRAAAADKIAGGIGAGQVDVAVQTISGAEGSDARSQAAAEGERTGPTSHVGPYATQRMTLDSAELAKLAADPGVVAIEPDRTPRLLDERQGLLLANGDLGPTPGSGYLAAYDSLLFGPSETPSTLPFIVDVTDSAIGDGTTTPTSDDMRVDGLSTGSSRIAYVHKLSSEANDAAARQGCDGHGTLNASIIAGNSPGSGASATDAAGFHYGMGVEPRARIGGTTLFRCSGVFDSGGKTFRQIAEDAYTAAGPGYSGARIVNNSWGAATNGAGYDATAQEYDAIVRDAVASQAGAQQMVEVVAAGNDGPGAGTLNTPATAKNVDRRRRRRERARIRDGRLRHVQQRRQQRGRTSPRSRAAGRPPTAGSSRTSWRRAHTSADSAGGPPARPSTEAGSAGPTPTRWASSSPARRIRRAAGPRTPRRPCPGYAAAARWAYRRAIGPYPSAAMVKAMLLGGTTPVSGNGAGVAPGVDQGFGLARLQGAATAGRWFDDEPVVFTQSGQSFTRTFDVTDDAQPVRVTLAWTDAPGPLTGAAYVNDLDLEVSGAGALYRGNHIVDGVSAPGGAPDPRNNVESVIVPAGQLDSLAVRVRATNVAGDGVPGGGTSDQDFALVVSNVGSPTGKAALATTLPSVSDEDGDGVIEPQEHFSVSAAASNTGALPAAEVAGALTDVVAGHHDQRLADVVRHARPRPELVARDIQRDPRQQRLHGHPGRLDAADGRLAGGDRRRHDDRRARRGLERAHREARLPVAIPDGNAAWTTIPLTISDGGTVQDLKVQLTQITIPGCRSSRSPSRHRTGRP